MDENVVVEFCEEHPEIVRELFIRLIRWEHNPDMQASIVREAYNEVDEYWRNTHEYADQRREDWQETQRSEL